MWIHAVVVVACSLAASKTVVWEEGEVKQCLSQVLECKDMDHLVLPAHTCAPLVLVCAAVLTLGMPTLLVPSKMRDAGVMELCRCLLLPLLAFVAGRWMERPMLGFATLLHACAASLCGIRADFLVGGGVWISFKYTFVCSLLAWVVHYGPPISTVRWMDASQTLCAYQAHLVGVLFSGCVAELLTALLDFFAVIHTGL